MTKRFRRKLGRDSASFWISKPDPLALLGAAYLATEDAYVALDRERGLDVVVLRPKKGGVAALAAAFERDYADQLVRWAISRKALESRAAAVSRMLTMAERLSENASTLMPELAPEQKTEIAGLLKEAEGEPRDPLDISKPWEELRKKA